MKNKVITRIKGNDGKDRWKNMGVWGEKNGKVWAIIDSIPVGFSGLVSLVSEDSESKGGYEPGAND